jgi:hypothetical protein
MDPVSAMAAASAAFGAVKKGFEIGRDIEQMAGDLGRWMSAVSDISEAEKQAQNPPIFKKLMTQIYGLLAPVLQGEHDWLSRYSYQPYVF